MGVKFKLKTYPDNVVRDMRRKQLNGLRGIGAYGRKIARNMVRKKTKNIRKSAPGQPPRTAGIANRNLRSAVIFGVENASRTLVIGPSASVIARTQMYHEFGRPQILKGKRRKYRVGGAGPMRRAADGRIVFARLVTEPQRARAERLDLEFWPDSKLVKVRNYPPRPLMQPTLVLLRPRIPQIFSNAIING